MCISIYIYIERYIGIDIDIKPCITNRERIKKEIFFAMFTHLLMESGFGASF